MKAEAAECVRTAVLLGLDGSELAARGQLVFLEREACRWPEADEATGRPAPGAARRRRRARRSRPRLRPRGADRRSARAARRSRATTRCTSPDCTRRCRASRARARDGRLRVGYLSADFHQHATSQLMAQMLECHDRSASRSRCFRPARTTAARCASASSPAASTSRSCAARASRRWPQRIRELGIDLLVDLKGATYDTLLPVLAQRPAPLQVDLARLSRQHRRALHRLPDRRPRGHAARSTPRTSARRSPSCRIATSRTTRTAPCRGPRPAPTGACRTRRCCCAPSTSRTRSRPRCSTPWCALLHALPDAVLWLLQWNTNVQAALTKPRRRARGIDAERLVFAPSCRSSEHLSRLACADVYLDAWPCNAHTTAGEALWVGVPVVTIEGADLRPARRRQPAARLRLRELVCADVDAYRATVVALAEDRGPPRRACGRACRPSDPPTRAVRRRRLRRRHREALPAHVAARRRRRAARAPARTH